MSIELRIFVLFFFFIHIQQVNVCRVYYVFCIIVFPGFDFTTTKIMVHNYQINAVPEELYNLAQLAEVATVRLTGGDTYKHDQNTAEDLSQDKMCRPLYYGNKEQNNDKQYDSLLYHTLNTFNNNNNGDKTKTTKSNENVVLNCAKKKWKNEWVQSSSSSSSSSNGSGCYRHTNTHYPLYHTLSPSTGTDNYNYYDVDESMAATKLINRRRNSIVSTSPQAARSSSSASASASSDDDSQFYYSHKIFDRKKLHRRCDLTTNVPTSLVENSNVSHHHHHQNHVQQQHHDHGQISTDGGGNMSDLEQKSSASTSGYISDTSTSILPGDDVHTCPDCGKRYSTSSNLARHRQTHR